MTFRPLLFALALASTPSVLLAQAAPGATAAVASPLVGHWTYSVEIPSQTIQGILVFEEQGGVLGGSIAQTQAPDRLMPVRDLTLAPDGSARFWIEAPGEVGRVDFTVRVSAPDQLSGQLSAMGYGFDLAGRRAPSPSLPVEGVTTVAPTPVTADAMAPAVIAGHWQYAMETPQGAMNGTLELTEGADGTYAGRVVRGSGDATPLTSVTRDGNTATLAYANARYGTLTMRLSFVGDTFTGTLLVGETELPVTGTRLAH